MYLPNETYVCEEGRRQQAGAHLIESSVIYIQIGWRIQVAAVQDWSFQVQIVTAADHYAVHGRNASQLIVRNLSRAPPRYSVES